MNRKILFFLSFFLFLFNRGDLIIADVFPEKGNNIKLSINECIKLALEKNLEIKIAKLNPEIQDYEIISAKSDFDPLIRVEVQNQDEERKPVTFLSGVGWKRDYKNLSQEKIEYDVNIAKKLITGGTFSLSLLNSNMRTNSIFAFYDETYTNDIVFSLKQPLLKNFGKNNTLYHIKINKNNLKVTQSQLKQKIMEVISQVQKKYWELVYSKEYLKVSELSLKLSNELLKRNKALYLEGRITQVEIIQAEAGVASREEGIIIAQNQLLINSDRLANHINLTKEFNKDNIIIPKGKPIFIKAEIDPDEFLKRAKEKRPEFLQAKINIENLKITLKRVKNQLLPRLDLVSSFTLNGYGSSGRRSFDDTLDSDTRTWIAGMVFEYPLGNRKGHSEYSKLKIELEKANTGLVLLEKRIELELKESIRNIETNLKRIDTCKKYTEVARKILETEKGKLDHGMSTTVLVLDFQEDLTNALDKENRAIIDYQESLINLDLVTAQILEKNNIFIE
jgi:outer membrane protein TolC